MNVFSLVNSSKIEPLSTKNYENKTQRKKPYYQSPKHYAVCPDCSNPVEIINLYVDNKTVKGNALPLYARHVNYDVNGIATYDNHAYLNCSLSDPTAIDPSDKRSGKDKTSKEIVKILQNNAPLIHNYMCQIIGINISESLFDRISAKFCSENAHLYRGITKYNLPFSFLYMSNNNSIAYQFLKENDLSYKIKSNISKNSRNFEITKYNQIQQKAKPKDSFSKLTMHFSEHKISSSTKTESMKFIINEEYRSGTTNQTLELLNITLKYNLKDVFSNHINKYERIQDLMDAYYP